MKRNHRLASNQPLSRNLRIGRWGVAGLLAVGLVATACGSSSKNTTSTTAAPTGSTSATTAGGGTSTAGDTTGVTSSTITIGEVADVSGPVPGLFQGAEYGIDAWADYVNATGGIDGRKVAIDFKDSALSCPTYTSSVSSLIGSAFASVGTYAIFDSCGKAPLVAHPNFPNIQGAVLTPSMNLLPHVFTPVPSPSGFATTGYQYVKDKFPTAIAHTAALYGSAVLQDFKEQSNAAKSIGYTYVYTDGLSDTATNFTADILRMKSEGIQIVDMQDCDAIEVADFTQQAQQQDFKPLALFSAAAYDPGFFTDAGSANADYVVMALPVALYLDPASTIPNVVAYNKYLSIAHPGTKPNLFGIEAFAAGLLFQQAMSAAGPNPSRSATIAALDKITSFDGGGLIGPTNPGGKVPGVCYVIAGISNHAFVRVTPATGYECQGTFVPYSGS